MSPEREIEPAESDNYYRILGTTSKASPETIRKRYLERVRAFPPEEHPEEFKRIRKAYDTLKDPIERSKYDLDTKYGGRISRLVERSEEALETENIPLAEELLEEAHELAGEGNVLMATLRGQLASIKGDQQAFHHYYDQAEELVTGEDKFYIRLQQANVLIDQDRFNEASELIQQLADVYPEKESELNEVKITLFMMQNEHKKALELLEQKVPASEEAHLEDIDDFTSILYCLHKLERPEETLQQYQQNLQTIISRLDPGEKTAALDLVFTEFMAFVQGGKLTHAHILEQVLEPFLEEEAFQDMPASLVHGFLNEIVEEFIELEPVIIRMSEDEELFPAVKAQAFSFYMEAVSLPLISDTEVDDFMPRELRQAMEQMHEEYLQGIEYLQENYPLIYEYFEPEWEALIEKHRTALAAEQESQDDDSPQLNLFDPAPPGYEQNEDGTLIRKNKVGRNDPCPCGSGRKFKHCCG